MPSNQIAPMALKISEACSASRCGRTTIYEAIKQGELRAVKRGKSTSDSRRRAAPVARKSAGRHSQSPPLTRSARVARQREHRAIGDFRNI